MLALKPHLKIKHKAPCPLKSPVQQFIHPVLFPTTTPTENEKLQSKGVAMHACSISVYTGTLFSASGTMVWYITLLVALLLAHGQDDNSSATQEVKHFVHTWNNLTIPFCGTVLVRVHTKHENKCGHSLSCANAYDCRCSHSPRDYFVWTGNQLNSHRQSCSKWT